MHLLSSCSYYLYCHIFTSFVIKCSYNLSKSTSSQALKQFISISYLLMFSPDVPSFKVIFPRTGSDSNVVNCFLIDEFNPLMFWKNLLILLNNFFARKSRQWFPQTLKFLKMTVLNNAWFLFIFLQFIRSIFLDDTTFRLHFNFASTSFSGCANFPGWGNNSSLFIFFMWWSFKILSHRFRWISSAFIVGSIIKEIWYFWSIPSISFMMFIKFDLKVYLHINNNNCINKHQLCNSSNKSTLKYILMLKYKIREKKHSIFEIIC